MTKSERFLPATKFSHIYIEKRALKFPVARKILEIYKGSTIVEINHYKDIFCRHNQNFQLQKKAQKLILAVKEDNFLYRGPDVCQNFGNDNFYYTSPILNCVYNCDYCYLQGMYPSANIVVFVNIGDFFNAVRRELDRHPVYLTVSYDTDLLAFENIIPYASMWIKFASRHPSLKIEIRTKSANYSPISSLKPSPGVILAWTLSPEYIAEKYEKSAPSLASRLSAITRAVSDGWNVRLCFDPVVKVENWRHIYGEFIEKVFSLLPPGKIYDIGIGAFRMSSDYLKRIRKSRFDSDLIYYPFECRKGVSGYPEAVEKELVDFVYRKVMQYIVKERIFL